MYEPGDGIRTGFLKQTLDGLLNCFETRRKVHLILADDSPYDGHRLVLDQTKQYKDFIKEVTWTAGQGLGANLNFAVKHALTLSDTVFVLENDWVMQYAYNIDRHIDILETDSSIAMIRFGFLGGHMQAAYNDHWWRLKRGSGHYVYSHQVRAYHKRFFEAYGWFLEGVSPGTCEDHMCARVNYANRGADICFPTDIPTYLNAGLFHNIGTAYSLAGKTP
jgi:hypothetical protein